MNNENNTIISVKDLVVAYGTEVVINGASLEITKGSFLPFVGPNGAGKTTLLRTILGLIKPKSGNIISPFVDKPPGYVPQLSSIDPIFPVTVREIMEMGLYPELGFYKKPSDEMNNKIDDALEKFSLTKHQNKLFSELSGGMKQKVMAGRTLVGNPDVLIMDEPTAGLDEESELDLLEHLFNLTTSFGKTVLLALHGLDLVRNMAKEVVSVQKGRVHKIKIDNLLRNGDKDDS